MMKEYKKMLKKGFEMEMEEEDHEEDFEIYDQIGDWS